jgi:predicted AlkP superfamily phosphohydrolase/phosphomutase
MAQTQMKVLVFGMDGATWDILRPLVESGRTPTLARMVREGATGPLASTIHPHSPTAWSSFLTGANPGRHGIFDFTRRKPGSYDIEVVSTRTRGGKAIWQILSEKGIRCGVLNVPMTYPPEKVAGYFVSGVFTSEPFGSFTYPRTILDELKEVLGHAYLVDAHRREFEKGGFDPDPAELRAFLTEINEVEKDRTDASLYLIRKYDPQFVVHVATSTDRAQHTYWQFIDPARPAYDPQHEFRDAIASTYVAADAELKRLWEAMGEDTTVIVMSDHGGAPLRRVVLINEWLKSNGYLTTFEPQKFSRKALVRSAFKSAYQLGRKVLPRSVRARISGRVNVGHKAAMKYMRPTLTDWSRTRAFSEGTFGNIVLNVRGVQPMGIVEPGAEYEALRCDIRTKLEELVDPESGERVVLRTYAREELYSGDRINEAPDIVAVLREGYQMAGDFLAIRRGSGKIPKGVLFASGMGNRYGISGIHSPTGILLAHGLRVARGAHIQRAHITDIAPTILQAFGVQVPAEMDGTVLTELVTQ